MVGILWTWSVLCEVGLFLAFTRLFGHMSATMLIGISGVATVVRWLAFPMIWPAGLGVPGFFVVQVLHAFSAGLLIIAVQKLIAETVAEERTGAAQGVASGANGLSMALFTLISGPLYSRFGANAFFAMAALAMIGCVLIWMAGRSAPEGRDRR